MSRLEGELAEQGIPAFRLNVGSNVGAQIARRYGVRGVPALILFDESGRPKLLQVGRISPESVLEALESQD